MLNAAIGTVHQPVFEPGKSAAESLLILVNGQKVKVPLPLQTGSSGLHNAYSALSLHTSKLLMAIYKLPTGPGFTTGLFSILLSLLIDLLPLYLCGILNLLVYLIGFFDGIGLLFPDMILNIFTLVI